MRGFTLIEATVTVAVLAITAAVVLPTLSNLTRAELRQAAGQLAGTVRATYDSAALAGEEHRLVFEVGKSTIRVEKGEARKGSGGGLAGLAGMLAGGAPLEAPAKDAPANIPPEIQALFAGGGQSDDEGLVKFQSLGHDLRLPEAVRVLDVWISGMQKPLTEGTAFLRFFPHGYTQDALLHLADEEGRVFTVRVAALTGKTEITGEYVEAPK